MTVEEWKKKNPPIQRKPITNADKIRAMTDEELAVFLYGLVNEFHSMDHSSLDLKYCKIHANEHKYDGWLLWVRQEAEEGE